MTNKNAQSRPGEWRILGDEQLIYDSQWLRLSHAKVGLPNGNQIEHIVVRMNRVVSTAVVVSDSVLLIWRHRFVPDVWGWELPGGIVGPEEEPIQAAAREVEEETGWRPSELHHLVTCQPAAGFADIPTFIYRSNFATRSSQHYDSNEAQDIEWVPLAEIPKLMERSQIVNAMTIIGLLHVIAL